MSSPTPTLERNPQACVLAGPPGVGKTSVAPLAAARLGLPWADLDEVITQREGRSPARLITEEGEASFRQAELRALTEGIRHDGVLALGGGTLTSPAARQAVRRMGPIVGLEAPQDVLQSRLRLKDAPERPLLRQGLQGLLQARRLSGLSVDLRLAATGSTQDVANDVADRTLQVRHIEATVGDTVSRVLVGRGLQHAPAGALAHLEPQRPVLAIMDCGISAEARARFLAPVQDLLPTHVVEVPGGEAVKTWAFAGRVLEEALAAGCGRQSVVLGMGGGATCDLAAFVAHLLGRGTPLVLVPSTLLSQVDASVGGKCALNMAAGRNLVGAFHAATDVIIDVGLLEGLDEAEYRSGLAELLKIAVIGDDDLFERLVRKGRADADMIARAVTLKAEIVQRDPYDLGERRTLNLGHTLGHALETASDHRLRHGEAVAIGMAAAARYSAAAGWASTQEAARIVAGLEALGLKTYADPHLLDRAAELIGTDKKGAAGDVALICIHGVADVRVRTLPLIEASQCLVRHGGLR